MYTLLPPMEPQKRAGKILPHTALPLTKNQLVRDYLLKTSSTKNSYYVDIDPKPTHVITAPINPKQMPVEKNSPAKAVKEKYKTSDTQTLPNYQDNDFPTRSAKKNTSYKIKASPKKVAEVEKTAKKESSENPTLREICFIKNSFGKRIIAKYNPKNGEVSSMGEDNLIIVWNDHNKAQVMTYKGKDPRRFAMSCQPHEKSPFRVHDFSRWRKSPGTKRSARRKKAQIQK